MKHTDTRSRRTAPSRDEPRLRPGETLDTVLDAFVGRLDAEQSRAFRTKMAELDAARRRLH